MKSDLLRIDRVQDALSDIVYYLGDSNELARAVKIVKAENNHKNCDINSAARIVRHDLDNGIA